MHGDDADIEFLVDSKNRFEDFFGFSPRSYRAAYWGGLSNRAVSLLDRLGYLVDASATPQRLGILSSFPRENPYLTVPRAPYHLKGGLIEIPTSCFLIPLAIPTFRTLRYHLSVAFMSLFKMEALVNPGIILNLQFHASDFVFEGVESHGPERHFRDLFPSTPGGIKAKAWIRMWDRKEITGMTLRLLGHLRHSRFRALSEHYSSVIGKIPVFEKRGWVILR
jgi:hypothetical protein